jgi:hypothetical protein
MSASIVDLRDGALDEDPHSIRTASAVGLHVGRQTWPLRIGTGKESAEHDCATCRPAGGLSRVELHGLSSERRVLLVDVTRRENRGQRPKSFGQLITAPRGERACQK